MKKKAWGVLGLCAWLAMQPLGALTQDTTPGESVPTPLPTVVLTPVPATSVPTAAPDTPEPTVEPTVVPVTAMPEVTQAPTPEPTKEPITEPTVTPVALVTSTPEANVTPTPMPTTEPTAAPTAAPTAVPIVYPMPEWGGIAKDEKQDDPSSVRVHVSIRRAEGDARALDLILIPVTDDQVQNLREYLEKYPVTDGTFAQHEKLQIDRNDDRQRYEARIPYGVRFVFAWRVECEIACEGIFEAYEKPAATKTPEVTSTPTAAPVITATPAATQTPTAAPSDQPTAEPTAVPTSEPTVEPTIEPTIEPTVTPTAQPVIVPTTEPTMPPMVFYPNIYYGYPKDDDTDGLYTRSEYRVNLNPAVPDSDGDGYFDFMDFYLAGRLSEEACPTIERNWEACVRAGLLGEGRSEAHAWEAARDMEKRWHNSVAPIGWADLQNARVLALSNSGVFLADYAESETPTIIRALSMAKMGYPAANRHERTRIFDVSEDGAIALLYDRRIEKDTPLDEGEITQDAVIIDTQTMTAYPMPGTQSARALALSPDGSLIAVWTDEELTLWHLATGEAVRIMDEKQLARVEMLAFAADNRLIVSLTQMGYNAFLPDGKPTIGGAGALGVFVRSRDSHGMSVYDNEHQLLRIDAQVSLTQAGIYIKGEDGESVRNFAPRQIRIAAGLE